MVLGIWYAEIVFTGDLIYPHRLKEVRWFLEVTQLLSYGTRWKYTDSEGSDAPQVRHLEGTLQDRQERGLDGRGATFPGANFDEKPKQRPQ